MIPRVHIETLPRTAEDEAPQHRVPAAVAWAVAALVVVITLLGSSIGAAATFGANASSFLVVMGVMLVILAAVALAPRVLRARR